MTAIAVAMMLPVSPSAQTTGALSPGPVASMSDSQSALEAIEDSIMLSRDRVEELKLEIEEMRGDRSRQNAALIEAAQRVKAAEAEIAALEGRLDGLIVAEIGVRGRLDGADAEIAGVLAALERITRNPPPAIVVDPSDALGSARGALLISAILPQLTSRADSVTTDLKELTDIKAAALEEEQRLRANFAILEEEQLRIATLIVARRQGEAAIDAELIAEEAAAAELAARAATLKDLIASLTRRAEAVAAASQATQTANAGGQSPPLDAETIRMALANTSRTEPAIPFAAARGYLAMPANGVKVVDFGSGDGFGGISQGLSVATRAQAQVVAPSDGWVLYQGDYLNYGQIVILNPGQGYAILLAGLDKVTVETGQFLLMGEPVGTMGSRTFGQRPGSNAGAEQPTLYIELRKNNEPVDPTGWWAQPQATQTAATQNG